MSAAGIRATPSVEVPGRSAARSPTRRPIVTQPRSSSSIVDIHFLCATICPPAANLLHPSKIRPEIPGLPASLRSRHHAAGTFRTTLHVAVSEVAPGLRPPQGVCRAVIETRLLSRALPCGSNTVIAEDASHRAVRVHRRSVVTLSPSPVVPLEASTAIRAVGLPLSSSYTGGSEAHQCTPTQADV